MREVISITHREQNSDETGEPRMARLLTSVYTEFVESRCNYRILFGTPLRMQIQGAREGVSRRRYDFLPGSRFALDLWKRNAYGTLQWRCFVLEAIHTGDTADRIPRVVPGARILMSTRGAAESALFLAWLAQIEASGTDPVTCPDALFESAHLRLLGSRADRTRPQRLSGLL